LRSAVLEDLRGEVEPEARGAVTVILTDGNLLDDSAEDEFHQGSRLALET